MYWIRAGAFDHSEHVVLRIEGSTSLGDDLVPELAQAFLRDDLNATDTGIRVVSTDSKGHRRLHVWAKVPGRYGLQVIEIYASGSGTAFKCLAVDGGRDSCDIGMSSRPINARDRQLYPTLRNLGDHATEHVIALDGIAIVVNPSNPVSQLSIPQLRAIYTRQISNWKSVGGKDAPIELFERDRNSGTYEMFTEKVIERDPQSAKLDGIPADHQIGDSALMVESIMRSPNSIGYVSSPMVNTAKALSISDGSGPAIQPTELSIVTEDYPICRRLLLYNWDAPGSLMNAFVRYTVYKPGQHLVDKTPFVELVAKVFRVSPPGDSPEDYKRIAADFDRIGLSFHFSTEQTNAGEDPGSQLDNLAEINVLRLRTFLAQHGGTGNDVLLIGFTDGKEKKEAEESLAHKRAESVATSLRAVGVTVPSENIRDFGAQLPVASNESIEGRRRNRRVEVWVRNTLDDLHGKVASR